jgi:serine/threonine protein kinase
LSVDEPSMEHPTLFIHPLHVDSHATVAPLQNTAVTTHQELASCAREAITAHAAANGGFPSDNALTHSAKIVGSRLVLACQEMQTEALDLPLLFAEVVPCRVPGLSVGKAMWNILAMGIRETSIDEKRNGEIRECFGSLWILMVSTEAALLEVLACLSKVGAIRYDLLGSYDVAEQIGAGSVSTVYCAKRKDTQKLPIDRCGSSELNAQTALKIFATENPQMEPSSSARNEAKFLIAAQSHPNIVGFYGLFYYAEDDMQYRWAMSLQRCTGGDLHDRIGKKGVLNEKLSAEFMFGISSALCHLHSRGVVHRDVKAENILIDDSSRPVLADFGIAALVDDTREMGRRCGSPGYTAPEVLAGEQYGAKVDIFGMGVILYLCLSGSMPFSGSDICSVLRRTVRCHINLKLEPFAHISVDMKTIVSALLQKQPDARPSSAAAAEHIYEIYSSNFQDIVKASNAFKSIPFLRSEDRISTKSEDPTSTSCAIGSFQSIEDEGHLKPHIPEAPRTRTPFWRRGMARSSTGTPDLSHDLATQECVDQPTARSVSAPDMCQDDEENVDDSHEASDGENCDVSSQFMFEDVLNRARPEVPSKAVTKSTQSRLRPLNRNMKVAQNRDRYETM